MTSSAEHGVPVTGSPLDPMTGVTAAAPLSNPGEVGPELVRHEQRLDLSTRWVAAESVRIHRRIVTETRMVPVEVRVEVLEVEHLPLTALAAGADSADPASTGPDPTPDLVLVLREEVPVVTLQIRETERVTVSVATVDSRVAVTEHLSAEQIDVSTVPASPAA